MFESTSAGSAEATRPRSKRPTPLPRADLNAAARLVGISGVCLFLEMALIRFINATVQVIAYFNNFVILATFLGMGFGALLARKKPRWFAHAPSLLFAFVGVLILLDRHATGTEDIPDLVAWVQVDDDLPALSSGVVVTLIFCACFAVFVPLGCELGSRLEAFQDRLQAYGFDLLGSIAGVLCFAIVSWSGFPPWVWFAIPCGAMAVLLRADGVSLRWRAFLLAGVVGLAALASDAYFSPYYKIHLVSYFLSDTSRPTHYSVFVDKLRIQDAIDFEHPELDRSSVGTWVPYYRLPYELRPAPARVLVMGGGSGNDTVIALKSGAGHVTTVEVDPVLVTFGHELHPQRPYADERVQAINDDARAFLRRTSEPFDLIVMNALDSHKQVAGLSTLRLESFIYTVQAFEDVRRHMTPQSVFVVHLSSSRTWMGERLFWSLTKAFGREPALVTTPGSPFQSIAFVYAPAELLEKARASKPGLLWGSPKYFHDVRATTALATDDWPHLYLERPQIPTLYLQVLACVLILSLLCFRVVASRGSTASLLHFMLLGASFMLLETRAITQFALLFGSTWLVNAIVVSSILIVIYLGNRLLQSHGSLPKHAVYAALLASLIVLYFAPLDALLPFGFEVRVLAAGVVIGVPVFAASLLFSDSYRRTDNPSAAFGANLVGVVIGGGFEYASMQWGLKVLYLGAALLYALAWLAERAAPGLTRSRNV